MARVLEIVTSSQAWRRSFQLDGVRYVVRMRWSERNGAWYADVLDEATDEPLVAGWRVTPGVPWAPASRLTGGPAGALVVLDVTGGGSAIETFEQLGTTHRVFYFPADEVAAIVAAEANANKPTTVTVTRTSGTPGAGAGGDFTVNV